MYVHTVCYCVRDYFLTAPALGDVFLDTTLPLPSSHILGHTLAPGTPCPEPFPQEVSIIKREGAIVPCVASFSSKQASGKVEGLEKGGRELTGA